MVFWAVTDAELGCALEECLLIIFGLGGAAYLVAAPFEWVAEFGGVDFDLFCLSALLLAFLTPPLLPFLCLGGDLVTITGCYFLTGTVDFDLVLYTVLAGDFFFDAVSLFVCFGGMLILKHTKVKNIIILIEQNNNGLNK